MRVDIERGFEVRVPEDRLRGLERFSPFAEQSGVRMAKAMPTRGMQAELVADHSIF